MIKRTRTRSGALYVMSRSRHSSTEYFGSPSECSPNSSTRLPVKSLIGEIDSKASLSPSLMNHLKDAFCNSIRSGIARALVIFANVWRARLGPGSSYASTVNASAGTSKVAVAMLFCLTALPLPPDGISGLAGAGRLRGADLGFSALSAVVLEAISTFNYSHWAFVPVMRGGNEKRQGPPKGREVTSLARNLLSTQGHRRRCYHYGQAPSRPDRS